MDRFKWKRPDRAIIVGIGTTLSSAIALASQLTTQNSALAVLLGLGGVVLTGVVAAVAVRERPISPTANDAAAAVAGSIWNVPRRLETFYNREEEIGAIELEMSRSDLAVAVLQGVGGVGKSSLAAAYAARHRDSLDVCWWVNASEPSTVVAGFASLGSHMGFSAQNQRATAHAALHALAGRRWLVIFDNAASPDILAPFIGSLVGGKVIITSRNPSWRHLARPIAILPFDERTATEFLLRGTGSTDAASAGLVARCLGGLPLALDVAIGHSNESGRPLDDLGQAYALNPVDTLTAQGGSQQMPWKLGLEELAAKDRAAAQLLAFIAFSEPNEPVPRLFLQQVARYLPARLARAVQDSSRLDELVKLLVRMAFIQVPRAGEYVIHPLTRDAVLGQVRREKPSYVPFARSSKLADWLYVWLLGLTDIYAASDHTYPRWPVLSPLATHGERILQDAAHLDSHLPQRAILSTRLARYYLDRGMLELAHVHAVNGVEWAGAALGEIHVDTTDAKLMLGWVLHIQGDYDRAIPLLEAIVAIRVVTHGPTDATTLVAMNELAGALVDRGTSADIERGLDLHSRVYATRSAEGGSESPLALVSLHNLSSAQLMRGAYPEARDGYERVLAGLRKLYGDDHPRPLIAQHRLAQALAKLGELASATDLSTATLNQRRRLLGDQHPDVIATRVQLADLLVAQGRGQDAAELYREALNAAEFAYTPGHPLLEEISQKLICIDDPDS